jgi:hypothetical protein
MMNNNFTIHYKGEELPLPCGEDGEGHFIWEIGDTEILDKLSPFEFKQYLEILNLPSERLVIKPVSPNTNSISVNCGEDDELEFFFHKLKN